MFFQRKTIFNSELYNKRNFYESFLKDLNAAQTEVILERAFVVSNPPCLVPRPSVKYPIL